MDNDKEILWEGIANSRPVRIVRCGVGCYAEDFTGNSLKGEWQVLENTDDECEIYRVAFLQTFYQAREYLEQTANQIRKNTKALEAVLK
jgi:hypothetical protein